MWYRVSKHIQIGLVTIQNKARLILDNRLLLFFWQLCNEFTHPLSSFVSRQRPFRLIPFVGVDQSRVERSLRVALDCISRIMFLKLCQYSMMRWAKLDGMFFWDSCYWLRPYHSPLTDITSLVVIDWFPASLDSTFMHTFMVESVRWQHGFV